MACPQILQILVGPAQAYEQNPLGHQKSRECIDATANTCFGCLVGVDGLMIRINEPGIHHTLLRHAEPFLTSVNTGSP